MIELKVMVDFHLNLAQINHEMLFLIQKKIMKEVGEVVEVATIHLRGKLV